MKTALELLGDDAFTVTARPGQHPLDPGGEPAWEAMLELVAQRAREEMRSMAVASVQKDRERGEADHRSIKAGIQQLPTNQAEHEKRLADQAEFDV